MTGENDVRAEAAALRVLLGVGSQSIADARVTPRDEALLTRILAEPVPTAATPSRRVPMVARLAIACATVAAVAVTAVSLQADAPASATPRMLEYSRLSVDDVYAGRTVPARDALRDLAGAAARTPTNRGSGDQIVMSYGWYVTSTDAGGHRTVEIAPTSTRTVLAPDGALVSRVARAAALDQNGRLIDANHYPAGGPLSVDELPAGSADPAYAATLPREPDQLRRELLDGQGGDAVCGTSRLAEATCLSSAAVELYTRWVVPSDLSAAVWSVLEDEPSFIDMGTVVDRLGRPGHAIALPPDPATGREVKILIVHPVTGQLLGWEDAADVLPGRHTDGPAVLSFQAIISTDWSKPDRGVG